MINAVPSATPANNQTVPTVGATSAPQMNSASAAPTPPTNTPPNNNSGKSKFSIKMLLGGILLLIIVAGSGVGLYLSQQTQDIRQDASTTYQCGAFVCNGTNYYGPDCNSALDCTAREQAVCAGGTISNREEPSCGGGSSPTCTQCTTNCGATGCSYSCPTGLSASQCDLAETRFMCTGKKNDGCNSANGGTNVGSVDYTKPEFWCKTFQFDSNHWSGAYSVVHVGNNGQVCVEGTGCNPDTLDWNCNPEKPTATYTSACTPGQVYSADGSKLSYDFTVSNVKPSADFERTVVFLSIGGSKLNAAQEADFEATFGKPTWASNGANPTCVNQSWCGYWLKQQTAYSPSMKIVWDNNIIIGGTNGSKTIKDLVAWGKANGITSWTVDANVKVNGIQNDTLGGKNTTITADACAPKPKLVCNDPCTTTAQCTADLGAGYECYQSACRLASNPTNTSCTPPVLKCDDPCTTTAQCTADLGAGYSCVTVAGAKKCRLTDNPDSASCAPPVEIVCNSDCTTNAECTEALGDDYTCSANKCRLAENPSNQQCEPITPLACNAQCTSDAQCQKTDSKYICDEVSNRCRHAEYPTQATCKKPAPVCLAISMSKTNPAINDTVTFTCAQVADVASYQFRVIQPDGETAELRATGNVSSAYTITDSGKFRAECRLCPTGSNQCQPWPTGE